ncbi:hypothetical protein Tco_1408946, partial [Tanacetum coccineum]
NLGALERKDMGIGSMNAQNAQCVDSRRKLRHSFPVLTTP